MSVRMVDDESKESQILCRLYKKEGHIIKRSKSDSGSYVYGVTEHEVRDCKELDTLFCVYQYCVLSKEVIFISMLMGFAITEQKEGLNNTADQYSGLSRADQVVTT